MTDKTAFELFIYTYMPLCRLFHGHQNHRKNIAKRKALTKNSTQVFACFRRTIQSPKLSRSPEFFRRDRSFCKSLTKHIHKVSPQSHKGTDVLEDLSSLSSNQSSSFSCSSWTSRQSQSSQLQQQSWQGSQSSRWPYLTLHVPPEAQCGPQGV